MALVPGKYYVGSVVRLTINYQNDAGTDVDPTTVAIRVMSPCGVQTTYTYGTDAEVGKSSVGDYYADITPDETGRWHYRWVSTGAGTTLVEDGRFQVQGSPFDDDVYRAYGGW